MGATALTPTHRWPPRGDGERPRNSEGVIPTRGALSHVIRLFNGELETSRG